MLVDLAINSEIRTRIEPFFMVFVVFRPLGHLGVTSTMFELLIPSPSFACIETSYLVNPFRNKLYVGLVGSSGN